jgi:site-specific recombinase XerD
MREAVQIETKKGTKAHIWLSQAQVAHITALCDNDLEGKRDWIVLGLLLGAGLRRAELVNLTSDALKQQPTKNGRMRDVLEVVGKGSKSRVIPISEKLGARLREWIATIGGGLIARGMTRSGNLKESISDRAVFDLVRRYGDKIGMPELAPHDCRRTFAQLGYEAGVKITQLSTLLGHSSISVTPTSLNLTLDIETTASDFIPLT